MKRRALFACGIACGLASVGCGGKGDDVDMELPFDGGSVALKDCGYSLTTRVGAEAPQPGKSSYGADPTPQQIRLGFGGDPRTSMAVIWRTGDQDTKATTVRFAEGAELSEAQLTKTQQGYTFLYQSGFGNSVADQVRIHETHLCGLKADTAYSYQVGGDKAWSPVYTFRTAPDVAADPTAEIVIGFVGDSRQGYDVWQQVAAELDKRAPDLLLFSGDAVGFGEIQVEWNDFFTKAQPLLTGVPMVSAHGNHDNNSIPYFSQLAMPGDEENYGFDYGFAHITVLNDSPLTADMIGGSVAQFLQGDLTAHDDARWKLVMHHRPAWSAAQNHGSDKVLQSTFGPVLDAHRVDLVLNGHEHDYERTKPLRGGQVVSSPQEGTVYVVSGGAGAELYGNGKDFWTEVSQSTHGAATLRLRRDSLTLDAFTADGAAIDTLTIGKR